MRLFCRGGEAVYQIPQEVGTTMIKPFGRPVRVVEKGSPASRRAVRAGKGDRWLPEEKADRSESKYAEGKKGDDDLFRGTLRSVTGWKKVEKSLGERKKTRSLLPSRGETGRTSPKFICRQRRGLITGEGEGVFFSFNSKHYNNCSKTARGFFVQKARRRGKGSLSLPYSLKT